MGRNGSGNHYASVDRSDVPQGRKGKHRKAVSDILATHDGVRPVEQGEGDSFVAAFARSSDAVAAALELQRAPLAPIRLPQNMPLRPVMTSARNSLSEAHFVSVSARSNRSRV